MCFITRNLYTVSEWIQAMTIFSRLPVKTVAYWCSTCELPTTSRRLLSNIVLHSIQSCSIPSTIISSSPQMRRRAQRCGITEHRECQSFGMEETTLLRAAWAFDLTRWELSFSPFVADFLLFCTRLFIQTQSANFTIQIITTHVQWRVAHLPAQTMSSFSPDLMTLTCTSGKCPMLIVSFIS